MEKQKINKLVVFGVFIGILGCHHINAEIEAPGIAAIINADGFPYEIQKLRNQRELLEKACISGVSRINGSTCNEAFRNMFSIDERASRLSEGKLGAEEQSKLISDSNEVAHFIDLVSSEKKANLVSNEQLYYDFKFERSEWETLRTEGGALAYLKFSDSNAFVNIIKSSYGFHQIQLYNYGFSLEKDKKYKLSMLAYANRPAEIMCKFHEPRPEWESFQDPEYSIFKLNEGGNLIESTFIADRNTKKARFTCYFGQNESDTQMLIKSLKMYKQ